MTAGARPASSWWRVDALVVLGGLGLLLAWEASGLDHAVMRAVGTPSGFPWRDAWITRGLLHDGARAAGALLWVVALVHAFLSRAAERAPSRRERIGWWLAPLAPVLLVPLLKRSSTTSCPWDWQAFGGAAEPLPHWAWGVLDGGGGHCFPSGHATVAFAFLAPVFLWRRHAPARAARWLGGVLLAGCLLGGAQVLRGAHAPAHVLWTGWLTWTLLAAADTAAGLRRQRRGASAARASRAASADGVSASAKALASPKHTTAAP